MDDDVRVALLVAVGAFVALVALRGILPALRARRASAHVRLEMSEAISKASNEAFSREERAAALVKAGRTALTNLGRPRVAAHHAEWAHQLTPFDPVVIALAVDALGPIRAHARLERLLWTSLDAPDEAARAPALAALVALYAGPMRRPERARALERLAGPLSSGGVPSPAALASPALAQAGRQREPERDEPA